MTANCATKAITTRASSEPGSSPSNGAMSRPAVAQPIANVAALYDIRIIGRWSIRFATTSAPTQTSAPVCQPKSTTAETANTTPSETPRVSIPSTGTGWRSAIRTTRKSVAMPTRSAVSRGVVANP